jgi:hypothetical protein
MQVHDRVVNSLTLFIYPHDAFHVLDGRLQAVALDTPLVDATHAVAITIDQRQPWAALVAAIAAATQTGATVPAEQWTIGMLDLSAPNNVAVYVMFGVILSVFFIYIYI